MYVGVKQYTCPHVLSKMKYNFNNLLLNFVDQIHLVVDKLVSGLLDRLQYVLYKYQSSVNEMSYDFFFKNTSRHSVNLRYIEPCSLVLPTNPLPIRTLCACASCMLSQLPRQSTSKTISMVILFSSIGKTLSHMLPFKNKTSHRYM